MKKQILSYWLRQMRLMRGADTMRFYYMYVKNYANNARFKKQFPNVVLPPDYLMYESFQLNHQKYFIGGKEDAQWIVETVKPYISLVKVNILDWGCGPARIIRHMPGILGPGNKCYATDYNAKTIKWCTENIRDIEFSNNNVNPPLNYSDNYFSFIYGISILTHLSKENQRQWSLELNRIISPYGIVFLTTHGEAFMEKLTHHEIELYKKGELVSRGKVTEGHRTYGTFHPPVYIKNIFENSGFEVVKHIPGKRVHESYISQDVWILRKQTT